MRKFQQKNGFKTFFQSRTGLIILGILLLTFAWNVFSFLGKMSETIKNRKMAAAKITELEKVKGTLSADIANLKTDKGVEESIREKFGLAKEGEGMIVIVDDKNSTQDANKKQNGFLMFWKNLFK